MLSSDNCFTVHVAVVGHNCSLKGRTDGRKERTNERRNKRRLIKIDRSIEEKTNVGWLDSFFDLGLCLLLPVLASLFLPSSNPAYASFDLSPPRDWTGFLSVIIHHGKKKERKRSWGGKQ